MGQAENNNHVEGRAFVYNILLFFKATIHIWGILGEKNLNQNNHMFQANPPWNIAIWFMFSAQHFGHVCGVTCYKTRRRFGYRHCMEFTQAQWQEKYFSYRA